MRPLNSTVAEGRVAAGGAVWPLVRRALAVAGLAAVCALSSACGLDGLTFRQDHRLAVVSPQDFSSLHLPFTVHWRFTDPLGAQGGAAWFGVFVDSTPVGPGDSVHDLDRQARTGLTVTRNTSLSISGIDTSAGPTAEHDVTVVLLDAAGRRIGETAARLAFYLAG